MHKKSSNKKDRGTSFRQNAVLLLIIVIAGASTVFFLSNTPTKQASALSLKQNVLNLKKIAERSGYSWTYKEGCTGKGGVYNDTEASACQVSLTNETTSDSKPETVLESHIDIFKQHESILFTNPTQLYSTSTVDGNFTHAATVFDFNNIEGEFCELVVNKSETNSVKSGLSCSVPSDQFYFDRNDI